MDQPPRPSLQAFAREVGLDDPAHRNAVELLASDFLLDLPGLLEAPIAVAALRGREAVNELYVFELIVWFEPHVLPELSSFIGRRAGLRLPHPHGSRPVYGVIDEVTRLDSVERRTVLSLRLVPSFARLQSIVGTRVFQELSATEVVDEVLRQHDVACNVRVSQKPARRAYIVQYNESDADFVRRILAEEGLAFVFEHAASPAEAKALSAPPGEECFVVFDSPTAYAPIDGGKDLIFRPPTGAAEQSSDTVHELRSVTRLETDQVTLRAYDYTRAADRAGSSVPTPPPNAVPLQLGGIVSTTVGDDPVDPLEHYDPHVPIHRLSNAQAHAVVRLEQQRVGFDQRIGVSDSRRLAPGRTVRILDHDLDAAGVDIVLWEVVHRAQDVSAARPRYRNEFRGVAATTLLRPRAPARRFVQAVETGLVVGPSGHEIDANDNGMVKVQFPWDRRGRNNERSSCWIRVSQPWAGAGYGFQFVPRIGAEVVVSFLGGDPDRPIVTGSLTNPANPPLYGLPERLTRSGIRTQTSPRDGGYNELLFEDRQGEELVSLRAQRNLEQHVLHDRSASVGGYDTTQIGGERRTQVGSSDTLEVAGDQRVHVRGTASELFEGERSQHVKGARISVIGGADDTQVGKDFVMRAGQSLRLLAGTAGPADAVLQSSHVTRVAGAEKLQLVSPKTIELVCGTSRITLAPDKITLTADHLELVGGEDVITRHKDTSITLNDKIKAASAEVVIEGSAAKLTLGSKAELLAPSIALAKGQSASREKPRDPEAKKGHAKFKLTSPPGMTEPLTVVLQASTGERSEQQVDPNGEISLEGLEGDDFEIVEIRVGDVVLQHSATGA